MTREVRALTIDHRDRQSGHPIPTVGGYVDQPYVVTTHDGHWLCVMTTGPGLEGDDRQHVVSTRSADHGATWEPLVEIESLGPPESSWAMPLIVPSGRVYVFYVYNGDNVRSVPGVDGTQITRVDTLGQYVFKYSDDGGRSWSPQRYVVPLRPTALDLANTTAGATMYFWGVGKPVLHQGSAYIGLSRVGNFAADGFMERSEGLILRSDDIATEPDPAQISWVQLPEEDGALAAPHGPVADEQNVTGLSDGAVYCVFRTVTGHLAEAYSHDRGHTWTEPTSPRYASGRRIKHPRAAGFVRRFSNGKYVLWFHNHSGTYYAGRNPVWLAGGVEREGRIHWSEPEILLYDREPSTRISYPDFIEENGCYFVTETHKTDARVHKIDPALLEGLWDPDSAAKRSREGVVLDLNAAACQSGLAVPLPALQPITPHGGLTVEMWVRRTDLTTNAVLASCRDRSGTGFEIRSRPDGSLDIELGHDRREAAASTGEAVLGDTAWHHLVVIVDGGPGILTVVVDGVLNDGGEFARRGWAQLYTDLGPPVGRRDLDIAVRGVEMRAFRIYDRAWRTAEAVAAFRAARET